MTDDELKATAGEVFKHFDRRESASERTLRLREWAISVSCWDGALPLAVIAIPKGVSILFANRQGAMLLTCIYVPIVAFVIRYLNGISRYRNRQMYIWQLLLFFIAILLLFALDALLVLSIMVQNGMPDNFWAILLTMFGVYVAIMAIAMFPARTFADSNQTLAGRQHSDS